MASVGSDGQLRVVDVEKQKCVACAALHSGCINDVCWDASNKFLYTVGSEGDIVCTQWSLVSSCTPKTPREPKQKESQGVVARFCYSNEECRDDSLSNKDSKMYATSVSAPHDVGQFFVTGGYDGKMRQWDTRKFGHLLDVYCHEAPLSSIEHSQDDTMIVTSSLDGFVRLWDTNNLSILRTYTGANGIPLAHAIFSPMSDTFLCIPLEASHYLWSVPCFNERTELIFDPTSSNLQHFDSKDQTNLPFSLRKDPANKFLGHTAAEFLVAPGPFVFGCYAFDGEIVIIPLAPTAPSAQNSSFQGLGIWLTSTGQCLGHVSSDTHEFSPITSVSSSHTVVGSEKSTTLVATSGDFPDNCVVVWCVVSR